MKNRMYYDLIAESGNKVYVDLFSIESFEAEGDMLLIHMDSGTYHKVKLQVGELNDIFEKNT